MPNIEQFWDSLKLSWSRRLMSSEGIWQKILQLNLLYNNYDMADIWYGGPTLVQKISEKMTNLFWRETIKIFSSVMKEISFAHPHFFFHLNIFDNDLFRLNGIQLNRNDFPTLWRLKIAQVGDFFNPMTDPPLLLALEDLNSKYNIHLDFLSYHRIKSSIKLATKNLNYKIFNENLSDTKLPRLPAIHKLGCLQSKGCGSFYQTLRAGEVLRRSTAESENKWHTELGTVFSIDFWDKIWKLTKNSMVNNKMKWVQLQINRYLLPTNYTVNKYKPSQDPRCTFCSNHTEMLPTLLWVCPVVQGFWEMVGNILTHYFPQFQLGRKEAIFGHVNSKQDSVLDTILLLSKQFLLKQKFTSKILDDVMYINFMRQELSQMTNIMQIRGKMSDFLKNWDSILDHFEVSHSGIIQY